MIRIARILFPFVGGPVTKAILDLIASSSFTEVVKLRREYRGLAARAWAHWLDSAVLPEKSLPPIRAYEMQDWRKALGRAFHEEAITKDTVVERQDIVRTLVRADLHGRNAERNTMVALAINDETVLGWARVDPEPPTCPLCRLTISRGPVYTSKQAAGGDGNDYHGGCTCEVVPVRDKNAWPGRDQYLAERQLYRKSKGNAKEYRALVAKANKDAVGVTKESAEKSAGITEKESP